MSVRWFIALALVLGVGFSVIRRKVRPPENRPLSDFDGYDLVLMFFPALLFLLNPVLEVLMAGAVEEKSPNHLSPEVGPWALLVNIAYFFFVGAARPESLAVRSASISSPMRRA